MGCMAPGCQPEEGPLFSNSHGHAISSSGLSLTPTLPSRAGTFCNLHKDSV